MFDGDELMTDPVTGWVIVSRVFRKIPDWAGKICKAWLSWFWHLQAVGKVVVTLLEIVVVFLVCSNLPISAASRTTIVQTISVGLFFLMLAGILFGRPHSR